MLKKKFTTLLLAVSLICCSITGCGGTTDVSNQRTDTEQERITESNEASEKPDAAESGNTENSKDAAEQNTTEPAADTQKSISENPTASELVGDIVMGWNLGNSLDSHTRENEGLASETSWQNPKITKEMIDAVKATGINAMRVPVTWYNHMDSNYKIDDEWMNRVEEVVNYVLDNDMYCIINVHHDTGENGWLRASSNNLEENKKKFTAIWEQICERFGGYGNKLLFEGFNEILNEDNNWVNPNKDSINVVNELNQLFVDTVRSTEGNNAERCLIVNTYCAGANREVTRGFVLPTDTVSDKLIVEAHVYQPYYFVSTTSENATTWAKDKGTLEYYLKNMYETFVMNGVPVIIGEFGCINSRRMVERQTWLQYYMETCRKYGIKCFWWDNGSDYKIFNRRNMKVCEPDMLAIMLTEAHGVTYVVDVDKLSQEPEEPTNLSSSSDNWSFYVNADSSASAELKYTEDGIRVEVTSPGTNSWDIQISYVNLNLEKDAHYRVSFDYYGEPQQTLNFNVMQNYPDYRSYYSVPLEYKTEPQHHKVEYVMSAESDPNSRVTFDCGGSNVGGTYSITIENLVILKVQ